jgi:hypothetical protein
MKSNPKFITEMRSLARSHTRTALNVLVGVMRNTKVGASSIVAIRHQRASAGLRQSQDRTTFTRRLD